MSEPNVGMCARCYDENVKLFTTNCAEDPVKLLGAPIGMYHCPECGAMLLAGNPHFELCKLCNERKHPAIDGEQS
jgi:hypothetical protein